MTQEHKYAHILRAIADGKAVQSQVSNGVWVDRETESVLKEISIEHYAPSRYRIKPRTININGYEVPEPVREPLTKGARYWLVQLRKGEPAINLGWDNKSVENEWLSEGLIHLTYEAAELHSKALLSFTKKPEVENAG